MRAVIEADEHIGAKIELKLDGFLGGELVFTLGSLGAEDDPPVAETAIFGVLPDQGISLKASRIGDDRAPHPLILCSPPRDCTVADPGLSIR